MLRLNQTPSTSTIRLRDVLLLRRGGWSLAFLLGAATLLAVIGLLAISGWFITAAAVAGTVTASAFGFDYFRPAALIRLCAIVRTAGRYGERLASHDAALGLLKDLRCRLFMALGQTPLQSASHSSHHGTASTMHRLVSDIDQLDQVVLRALLPWGWAGLMVMVVMAGLYWLSAPLLWAAMPGLLVAWLGLPLLALWRGIGQARRSAEFAERRRVALIEPLTAITSLVLWGRWAEMAQRVKSHDADYLAHQERQQLLASLTTALQQVALGGAIVGVLWQAEGLLAASHLTVPMLLAAVLAILALGEILAPLANSFLALGASLAARNCLNALTQVPPKTAQTTIEESQTSPLIWHLNVNQLTARQPGALVGPQGISLALQSGEILCVHGPSGCGKSTLLQVLAGELLPLSGEYCLNGHPIEQWSLHPIVGYLPQQWDLFDMSLAENLRLGDRDASDSELWRILDDLALGAWARDLPQGLETPLGEYGAAVSGGQARRIALGRVLLARRPILLLDEPLAGLDAMTRQQVVASLVRRTRHGIVVIVSHVPLELPASRMRSLYIQEDGRLQSSPPVPASVAVL
ncbi:thiol reductant ABC exporter subunit CydC [Halomonas sp. AOP13-D3-9]